MTRRAAVLLLCLAACRSDRHASGKPHLRFQTGPALGDTTRPPPDASARDTTKAQVYGSARAGDPPPAHPAAYLVWSADTLHAPWSVWMDAGGRVVATRPGVWVAAGARLLRWTERQVRAVGADCDCVRRRQPGPCRRAARVDVAFFTEVGDGGRVPVMDAPDSAQLEGEAAPSQMAIPVMGAGPYLLVDVGSDFDACGMHDLPAEDVVMFDLGRRRAIRFASDTAVERRDGAAAERGFAQTRGDFEDEETGPGSLWDFEAQWMPDGRLQGGFRFSRSSCYICGDRGMSYMRTVLVPDPVLPRWIAPWAAAPEPVRRYWRAEPRLRAAWRDVTPWARDTSVADHQYWYNGAGVRTGWSAVDSADAGRLLGLFRTR